MRSPIRSHSRLMLSAAAVALAGAALFWVGLGPACAIDTPSSLAQLAKSTAEEAEIPGVIMHYERDGEVSTVTIGSTEREGGVPLTGDETLRLGSITKSYMAALTLLLVEDGVLELDTPISELLPVSVMNRLPKKLNPTLRHVLGHQSGIPDYYSERFYLEDWKRDEPLTPEVALHSIRGLKRTMKQGKRFDYSNTNYQVLALILERATGQTVGDLLKERLLEPYSLDETYYDVASPPGDVIHGYGSPLDPWEPTFSLRENSGPDGGMFGTARDVAKWIRTLFAKGGELRHIGEQMIADPAKESARKLQGLGVEILLSRTGQRALGHTGAVDGYLTAAFHVPDTDTTVIVHMSRFDEDAFSKVLSGTLRRATAMD